MTWPHRLGEQFLRELARVILVHHYFFPDHISLAFYLLFGENRIEVHVAKHIRQRGQMLGGSLGIKASVVFGRESIDKSPETFHFLGNLFCRPFCGSLEKEMFEEVRDPA